MPEAVAARVGSREEEGRGDFLPAPRLAAGRGFRRRPLVEQRVDPCAGSGCGRRARARERVPMAAAFNSDGAEAIGRALPGPGERGPARSGPLADFYELRRAAAFVRARGLRKVGPAPAPGGGPRARAQLVPDARPARRLPCSSPTSSWRTRPRWRRGWRRPRAPPCTCWGTRPTTGESPTAAGRGQRPTYLPTHPPASRPQLLRGRGGGGARGRAGGGALRPRLPQPLPPAARAARVRAPAPGRGALRPRLPPAAPRPPEPRGRAERRGLRPRHG